LFGISPPWVLQTVYGWFALLFHPLDPPVCLPFSPHERLQVPNRALYALFGSTFGETFGALVCPVGHAFKENQTDCFLVFVLQAANAKLDEFRPVLQGLVFLIAERDEVFFMCEDFA